MDASLAPTIATGNVVGIGILIFSWMLVLPKGRQSEFFFLAAGNTLFQLGSLLYLTESWSVLAVSVALSNAALLSGIVLVTKSLEQHAGWVRWRRTEWLVITGSVLAMSLFALPFLDNQAIRTTIFSATSLLCLIRMLHVVLVGFPDDRKEQPILIGVFALLLTLLSLVLGARILLSWVSLLPSGAEESATLSYLMTMMAQLTFTFGLVSLVHRRDQRLLEDTLSTRDQLLALIAHDLRGPTGALANLLELLRDGKIPEAEKAGLYLTGAESARRNAELLENLLDWAMARQRSLSVRPEKLRIRDQVDEAVGPLLAVARNKGIEVKVEVEEDLFVFADDRMVTSILRNLVSNALKFTPTGGTVSLRGGSQDGRTVLTVADSGAGIPDEVVQKVTLGAHVASKRGTGGETGTGLGLALCREFLQANSGFWNFRTSPAGTEIILSLPSGTTLIAGH